MKKSKPGSQDCLDFSDYRRAEFVDKKSTGGTVENGSAEVTQSLLEINTNLNKETHFSNSMHNRSTIDILKGTEVNLTTNPLTPKLMHYDSAMPSPFLDKKQAYTPQLKPRALSPTNSEEHQYDIPFSHLKRSQQLQPQQRKSRYIRIRNQAFQNLKNRLI